MINGGYGRKMVVKELFGKVKIYRLHTRVDNRGSLAYVFDESIDDLSMLQMKNYIDFIWRKETNKYKSGRVTNENRACSPVCK